MNEDFITSTIARDFKVNLLSQNDNYYFYSALRPDVWHFVHAIVNETPEGFHTDIKQWHIPRYVMAKKMQYLSMVDGSNPPVFHDLVADLGISVTPERKIRFSLRAINEGLNEEFSNSFEQDIEALEKASSLVKEKDGLFVLPRAKTVHGNPVMDESKELIQAIAFERITRKKLDAAKFGIYSAYCTQADFTHEQRMPDSDIQKLIEYQFGYDPGELPDDVLQACIDAQKEFLDSPIWGPGINITEQEAIDIFSHALSKFKNRYSAQYRLMIEMHNTSMFLPLAVMYEVIPYRKYLDWMTSSLQPDSASEQYMLGTTAFIELFGNF